MAAQGSSRVRVDRSFEGSGGWELAWMRGQALIFQAAVSDAAADEIVSISSVAQNLFVRSLNAVVAYPVGWEADSWLRHVFHGETLHISPCPEQRARRS